MKGVIILYVLAITYVFLAFAITDHPLECVNKACVIPDSVGLKNKLGPLRGNNYNLDNNYDFECAVTTWHLSHFGLNFFLGLIAPDMIKELMAIGIVWELLEVFLQCHDILDIGFNAAGLLAGAAIRSI